MPAEVGFSTYQTSPAQLLLWTCLMAIFTKRGSHLLSLQRHTRLLQRWGLQFLSYTSTHLQ